MHRSGASGRSLLKDGPFLVGDETFIARRLEVRRGDGTYATDDARRPSPLSDRHLSRSFSAALVSVRAWVWVVG